MFRISSSIWTKLQRAYRPGPMVCSIPPGSGASVPRWKIKTLRAGLYNLSLNNSREDIIRAFLEGIALNTRWLLQPVKKFLGREVEQIHIVGGGAQSDVWCQIFADVMNVAIRQVEDPIYANARGAAWIGAVGIERDISFSDIPALVKFKQILRTRTGRIRLSMTNVLNNSYRIYQQMKPVSITSMNGHKYVKHRSHTDDRENPSACILTAGWCWRSSCSST